uniref:Uncharacterized protein n=1 Tax=Globisporangium ultimum (strain ATCC 200006 / CBS 805.95 / DAOM BR144) TaxID=431595 RepID=K3WI52_GLOUD
MLSTGATGASECKAGLDRSAPVTAFADRTDDDDSSGDDDDERSYILLHLIRVLALYLYVYISQNPFLVDDLLVQVVDTESSLLERASKLERELHALLLAFVKSDVASNQFDGVVHEKRMFLAIKKLFRDQDVAAKSQCTTLVALLSSYLTQLQSPIVKCEPFSMLTSTLEYLAQETSKQQVALRMLYPIVNAIDSLTIEQRECLDALTTLWKWIAAYDPSAMTLAKIVSRHHSAIIQIDPQEGHTSSSSARHRARIHLPVELGTCFVTTLLHHSDHIFRHDPEQYVDLQISLESDTEDEESGEDMSRQPEAPPAVVGSVMKTPPPTLPPLTAAEVHVTKTPSPQKRNAANNNSSKSKSAMRRRKKRDDKLVASSAADAAAVIKQQIKKIDDDVNPADDQDAQDEDESLPAVVCVGIAAAAGTIAAALCVIFT